MPKKLNSPVGYNGRVYSPGEEADFERAAQEGGLDTSALEESGAYGEPGQVRGQAKQAGKQAAKQAKFDAKAATKDELKAEAEKRGVEVRRADGKDGEPLVEDYVAALEGEQA